jgi:demethylmenaquinone methyltransferase/2-methoxy-6-polyprenyl-1,4-benzoquinol methylase
MFTHIAGRYEWFDHLASAGQDYLWRPRALWSLERFRSPGSIRRVLDLGCGTGEFQRLAARHFPDAQVVGGDFTAAMLTRAREIGRRTRQNSRLSQVRANAHSLPFADESFDLVLNAFVARNLSDLDRAFQEMRRVLRPGGVLVTLEIGEPARPWMGRLFHSYFDHVVPWMGRTVHSAGPYRYLPESLRSLPPRTVLLERMRRAGFGRVTAELQSMGIVTTFLAEAPPRSAPAPHPRG